MHWCCCDNLQNVSFLFLRLHSTKVRLLSLTLKAKWHKNFELFAAKPKRKTESINLIISSWKTTCCWAQHSQDIIETKCWSSLSDRMPWGLRGVCKCRQRDKEREEEKTEAHFNWKSHLVKTDSGIKQNLLTFKERSVRSILCLWHWLLENLFLLYILPI